MVLTLWRHIRSKNLAINHQILAAVYGEPNNIPIDETDPKQPTNPYGSSKLFFEKILADYDYSYKLKYISLRYFNAAGADTSGKIGEDHDPETHLIPLVLETALSKREKLEIYGTDYDTRDGTCIRDIYIHVTDLARAHVLAVEALAKKKESSIYNLGSGDRKKSLLGKYDWIPARNNLLERLNLAEPSSNEVFNSGKNKDWTESDSLQDILDSMLDYAWGQGLLENIGYPGRLNHPARQNLRVIPLELKGEDWFLQINLLETERSAF